MKASSSSDWRPLFLEHFRMSGSVAASCRRAGIDRSTYLAHLRSSPRFAQEVDDAAIEASELLEHEARRRALQSTPVRDANGEIVRVESPSDRLLELLLRREPTPRTLYDELITKR